MTRGAGVVFGISSTGGKYSGALVVTLGVALGVGLAVGLLNKI